MTAGIVGLGLIGGSIAKAYKRTEGIRVLAANRNKAVLDFAFLAEAVDEVLTMDNIAECDVLLLCTYPAAAVE